ncbi:MAG: hypothetical protein Q9227_008967 [Pyrenula ochraceoflavens]
MNTTSSRPEKKQKMSVTQTYFLAHTARGKLSKEASRSDHNLRLLVGHANLLDSLMLDLSNAEQEQEKWFNQTVSNATKTEESKHIQWADTVVEDPEEDWDAEDAESSDDESEYDEDEEATIAEAVEKSIGSQAKITTREIAEDDFEDDDEEDYADLALTRTSSRHPPELTSDADSDSDDESMPPSPPSQSLEFTEQQRKAIATTSFYDRPAPEALSAEEQTSFLEDGYYLPSRQQPALIAAY